MREEGGFPSLPPRVPLAFLWCLKLSFPSLSNACHGRLTLRRNQPKRLPDFISDFPPTTFTKEMDFQEDLIEGDKV